MSDTFLIIFIVVGIGIVLPVLDFIASTIFDIIYLAKTGQHRY